MRRGLWPTFRDRTVLASVAIGSVLVAVVAVLLFTGEEGTSDRADAAPFRAEAGIVHTLKREGIGLVSSGVLEWQDSRHYRRTSVAETVPGKPPSTTVLAADGEAVRFVEVGAPVYYRANNPEFEYAEAKDPLFHLAWGPTRARSIDALLDELRAEQEPFDPGNPRSAEVVRQDSVLGMPVVVIEYRPLWTSSTSLESRANGVPGDAGGSGRLWVDPERMFILRNEADGGPIWSTVVEVTEFEHDVEFEPGTFTFTPPPGKTEVVATR